MIIKCLFSSYFPVHSMPNHQHFALSKSMQQIHLTDQCPCAERAIIMEIVVMRIPLQQIVLEDPNLECHLINSPEPVGGACRKQLRKNSSGGFESLVAICWNISEGLLYHNSICVPEASIKGRDKYSHTSVHVVCNYWTLPLKSGPLFTKR